MGKCVSVNSQKSNQEGQPTQSLPSKPVKTGAGKSGAGKTGASKTGASKTGAAKTGAAKTGAKSAANSSKTLVKSGAQAADVESRPAIENQRNRRGSVRTYTRSATLRPSLINKQTPEATSATISKVVPNAQTQKEVLDVLKSHFLFNMLSEDVVKQVMKSMKVLLIEPNQVIYSQGHYGCSFYLLEKGKLEVQVDGVSSSNLTPKQCFGELGLIQDTPRSTTVLTMEKSILRSIDRATYKTLLSRVYQKKEEEGVGFLEVIPLFKQLTKSQLINVTQAAMQVRFGTGEKIIKEGEMGDTMYIIKEGTVHCSKYDQHIRDFHRGEYFGEQALLYQTKRNATCVAAGKVIVLSITRMDLVNALGQDLEVILSKNTVRISMSRNQYLKGLLDTQADMVYGKMEIKNFETGQVLLPANTLKSSYLLVVIKGSLACGDFKYRLYDVIGDEELTLENSKRVIRNALIAETEATIAMISRVSFEEIIGGSLKVVTSKNNLINIFKQIAIFKLLPTSKLISIVSALRIEEFEANSVIFRQDDRGSKFYIVKSGSVEIIKDENLVRKVEENGFFGERSVLMDESRTASAVTVTNTTCWVLHKSSFKELVDGKLQAELKKRIEQLNDEIELQDLIYFKTLNKGIICKAFAVFDRNSSRPYVLRTISKNSISLYNYYDRVTMEKNILKLADFPFIGKLIKTFKDDSRIYFLQEYANGQDMFDLLSNWERVGNENARFYAVGIMLVLDYLHTHSIMYRDLKPENIYIDEEGYPRVYDFANSKIIENRTYSTVGTPHYMAPEVITGKGYNFSADYWSLGILIYEILFNTLPFAPDAGDCYTIYQAVLSRNLTFPAGNHLSRPLIEKLLTTNPSMRGNFKSLKEHSWFIGISWDDYVAKQVPSPRKPKVIDLNKEITIKANVKNELFLKISVRVI